MKRATRDWVKKAEGDWQVAQREVQASDPVWRFQPFNELYYYGARWYLPGAGIFAQPDSIVPDHKSPQALNRFAYGYNNPVKYVDPTGSIAR